MNKEIKCKLFCSSKQYPNYKNKTLNHIKNISNIKRNLKHLKIDILNSNICLNSINNGTNFANKNNNNTYKNILTLDPKLEHNNIKNINTEILFSKREVTPLKKENIRNKIITETNEKGEKKSIGLFIEGNIYKNKTIVTPNKNRLTKKYEKQNLYRINTNYSNIYKNYKKIKNYYIPKSSRNFDSSNSSKNKINNIIYILNKKNEIQGIDYAKSRNDNKQFKKRLKNIQNSIKCKTSTDIKINNKIFSIKRKSIYQNLSTKSRILKERKFKYKNPTTFNSDNNIINKISENKNKIKSEPKKINIILKKKEDKKSFVDLIKEKEKEKKNIVIKKIKYFNLKKSYENIQRKSHNINYSKKNCFSNKAVIQIKSKTNYNSKEKVKCSNDKSKIKKIFKSCDISLLKFKKKKKKDENISKKRFETLQTKSNNLNGKYHTLLNDNTNKNERGASKIIGNYLGKRKKKIIKSDLHIYNNNEEEFCYNMLFEFDNEDNNKKINEIKTNKFDVKKPKEENMKYTIFKEFSEEGKEVDSNTRESHISKIIIGKIDGYNDIIEKDKINNLLNNNSRDSLIKDYATNYNTNRIKNINISFNESSESEKNLINMINIDDELDNMSTNDFKNSQFKHKNEVKNKDLNKNKNHEKIETNKLSRGKKINSKKFMKNKKERYNPIKFREKIYYNMNLKMEKEKK